MAAIDKLKALGRLDILKLIHFHLGSQITDIRFIKLGLQELTRFYVELRELGLDITHVDVGGGLGVDYDGTNSTSDEKTAKTDKAETKTTDAKYDEPAADTKGDEAAESVRGDEPEDTGGRELRKTRVERYDDRPDEARPAEGTRSQAGADASPERDGVCSRQRRSRHPSRRWWLCPPPSATDDAGGRSRPRSPR